jgi:hypothetical protein
MAGSCDDEQEKASQPALPSLGCHYHHQEATMPSTQNSNKNRHPLQQSSSSIRHHIYSFTEQLALEACKTPTTITSFALSAK